MLRLDRDRFPSLPWATLTGGEPLSPEYSGNPNEIWRLSCASGNDLVLRVRKPEQEPDPFWTAAADCFGLHLYTVDDLTRHFDAVRTSIHAPVPTVRYAGVSENSPWVAVEFIPGHSMADFAGASPATLEAVGAMVARLHEHRYDWFGSVTGTHQRGLEEFWPTVVATITRLLTMTHRDVDDLVIFTILASADRLPTPEAATPVMLDWDPTQIVMRDESTPFIIDPEAFVIAPAELDLVVWEYLLDEHSASSFVDGYVSVRPLPNPTAARDLLRVLLWLMEIQGRVPLRQWLARPTLIGTHKDQ